MQPVALSECIFKWPLIEAENHMGKMLDAVREVNAAIRNTAIIGVTGAIAGGGYLAYSKLTELDRTRDRIVELDRQIAEKQKVIDKMETAMRLLKVDQRLAHLDILDQSNDPSGSPITKVRFTEVGPNGTNIGEPREFSVKGEQVFVDNWLIQFEDKYIESADLLRGTSLTLFNKAYGENQNPSAGVSLDEVGSRPGAYARGGLPSEFEQELWANFWMYASNPSKAKEVGIRAAQGQAVHQKVRKGERWRIELRASGGLSMIKTE
jgi:uncharacterized coiled-coil protein SlyX